MSVEEEILNVESDDEEYEPMDLGQILNTFFSDEKGTCISDILVGIKKSIDTQNKILLKFLEKEKA